MHHFRELQGRIGVNLAQFQAQQREEDAVRLIAGFMDDINLPAPFRRQCAIDIVTMARGPIAPWQHDAQTIEVTVIGNTGSQVGDEIQAVRLATDLHQRIADLVMRRVPSDRWPEDVREAAGHLIMTYSEEGTIEA